MILVLDASAAVEMALNKKNANILKTACADADTVFAPDIYPSEITNVFWKYANFSYLDKTICEKGMEYCIELVDDFINTKKLCREAYEEAVKYKHPVYDMFYLICARTNKAQLLTCDKKLAKIGREMNVEIMAY